MRTLRRWLMTFGVTACTILCASGTRTIAAGERIDDDSRHFRHRLARLESLIEKQRQTLQIPGLAVVVIHQDQVVFLKGFGFRDLETHLPITPDSLFGIGSCTKAFTGLAAVISAEMGLLSLEDSPKKFLPYFQMSDAKADAQATLLDMLTHRTGLKAYDDEVWHKNDKLSRQEVIKAVMLKPPSAKFRTKFQYNNVMYSAVGECIGIANNSSWEGVISNRIFQPLGMNSSTTSMQAMRNAPDFTVGYHLPAARPLREKDHDLDNVAASGAINSTARDMAQWIRFMLGQGVFEGRRLISESSWQKLITPGIGNYALGWSVLDINGHIKETCRDQRGLSWIENLGQDLRYGARQMLKNPGFTAVAVLTLALGIGANTAIFGLANAILFRPPPFPEPDGLYYLHTRNPLREIGGISGPDLMDWQKQTHAFSRMAAFSEGELNLRAGEYSSVTSSVSFSKGFLDLFGVRPVLGRNFSDEEYTNSPSFVVMVGDRLWKRSLNQGPAIVGKAIFLDGQAYTIIGVLPKAVASLGDSWESAVSPDVCLPLNLNDSYLRDRSQRSLRVIARLKSGVTREEAEGETVVIGSRLAEQYPEANRGHSLLINRWDQERQGSRKYWLFFMGMVGCVLLIACANVANLLLARALTRGKEIGIRTALGAQRSRIVRQLLTESLLLALTGGALGILLSRWAMHVLGARFLVMFFGAAAASVEPVLDWRVLAFFLGTSVVAALLFGLIPALQISRVDANRALQVGNQRSVGNLRQRRISRGLVTAEVALTLILLISAATLIDAFMFNLRERTNPGFETAHLAYVRLAMLGPKYESQEQRIALLNLLTERLKSTPGIESVTIGSTLPKGSAFMVRPYATDRPPTSPGETLGASCVQADPRYFQMFNITALKGRLFTDRDRAGSQPVAIINEELASRLFRKNDPLGQRVTLPGTNPAHYEVIGVVRYKGEGYRWTIFVPIAQRCWVYPTVVIRTTSSPKASLEKLREELRATAPDQPTDSISTMDTMLRQGGLGSERGLLLLFNSFAGAGFFLAIVGIGSIVAYAASQRKREIGVRLALGATRSQILTLMLGEAIVPVAVGLGVGIVVNLGVQRVLRSQVSIGGGWEPNTPLIFALVIGAFSLVALLSSSFPAHRATRVDPMEALRHE